MLFTSQLRKLRANNLVYHSPIDQDHHIDGALLTITYGSYIPIPTLRPTSTAAELGPAGTAHTDIGSSGAYQTAVPIEV